MAFTRQAITEIDDALFESMFDSSISYMDAGSFDWNHAYETYGRHKNLPIDTVEGKKNLIRSIFQMYIDRIFDTPCGAYLISKDNHPVVYFASRVIDHAYNLPVFMPRPDAGGSRSYLYTDEFREVIRSNFMELDPNGTTVQIRHSSIDGNSINRFVNTMPVRASTTRTDNVMDDTTQENVSIWHIDNSDA